MSAAWILTAARTPRGAAPPLDHVAQAIASTLTADRSGRREPGLIAGAGASGRRIAWASGLGATTLGTDAHAGGLAALASLTPAVAGGWVPLATVAAVSANPAPAPPSRRIAHQVDEADFETAADRLSQRLRLTAAQIDGWVERAREARAASARRPWLGQTTDPAHEAGAWAPERSAAAAVRVVAESSLAAFPAPPRARIAAATWGAADPADPWVAPASALGAALEAAGVAPSACDAVAIDAPHVSLLEHVVRAHALDPARVNPCGGALARGRAGSAEGLCLLVDLLDWLAEQELRYGACVELLPDGGAAAVVVDCEAWA